MSRITSHENGALSRYLREIRTFPRLEREDEQQLLCRIDEGDPEATTRLVESNLGFVVKVAMEYRSLGVPFEDLLNEGNLGLIEAAKRFDGSKGTKFITYAIWWIRKSILKSIADHALVVRVPSYRRRKIYNLKKAETELRNRFDREPTREELAKQLKARVVDIDRLRGVHLVSTSLDQKIGEEPSASLNDFLADDSDSVEERLLSEEAGLMVTDAFRQLSNREQAVLGWRLALEGPTSLTLQQIGKRLKISRERVRQIESGAKHRLRRILVASLRKSSFHCTWRSFLP